MDNYLLHEVNKVPEGDKLSQASLSTSSTWEFSSLLEEDTMNIAQRKNEIVDLITEIAEGLLKVHEDSKLLFEENPSIPAEISASDGAEERAEKIQEETHCLKYKVEKCQR